MEQDIKKVTDWLNTHLDKTMIIQKKEQDDMDQIHIKLSKFKLRQAEHGSDDYVNNAIVLQGQGNTLNSDGNLVPLPYGTYDIVTTDLKITDYASEKIQLNTARANYILTLE